MTDNGEVLEMLEKKIANRLENPKLRKCDRENLEIQQLFCLYLKNDHTKIRIMWTYFQPLAWAGGIIVTAILTMAATGRFEIILR